MNQTTVLALALLTACSSEESPGPEGPTDCQRCKAAAEVEYDACLVAESQCGTVAGCESEVCVNLDENTAPSLSGCMATCGTDRDACLLAAEEWRKRALERATFCPCGGAA